MIIKANEIKTTSQENLRGGKGRVDMTHFLEGDKSFGAGRLFAVATMPAGSSIGEHPHIGEYEVYYVLNGTVAVTDNGSDLITITTGDTMVCKDGDRHSIENISDSDATLLFLVMYPQSENK